MKLNADEYWVWLVKLFSSGMEDVLYRIRYDPVIDDPVGKISIVNHHPVV